MSSSPINLQQFKLAIKELHHDNLESVKKQLITSLTKLVQTNNELYHEISRMNHQLSLNDGDELELTQDLALYTETIDDNKVVIREQKSRIVIIHDELVSRGVLSEDDKDKAEAKIFNALSAQDNSVPVDIKKDDEIQDDDGTRLNEDQDGVYL